MENTEKKKKNITFPHTFVILFIIIVSVSLMTYVIPAGQFDRINN